MQNSNFLAVVDVVSYGFGIDLELSLKSSLQPPEVFSVTSAREIVTVHEHHNPSSGVIKDTH